MCTITHLQIWLCLGLWAPWTLVWVKPVTPATVKSSLGPPDCDFEDGSTLCGYTSDDDSGLLWNWGSIHSAFKGGRIAQYVSLPRVPSSRYIYTISTNDGDAHLKFAKLVSPVFEVTRDSCLYFEWFSNYCRSNYYIGLKVFLRRYPESEDDEDVELSSISCIKRQRNGKWYTEAVQLPIGKYKLVFAGVYFSSSYVVIGVDDVRVRDGACSRGIVASKIKPGDCTFEDLTACGYTYAKDSNFQMNRVFKEQQQRGSKSQAPLGHYMVFDISIRNKYGFSSTYGKTSRLETPNLHIRSGCLSFSYFNSVLQTDDSLNALDVYKRADSTDDLLIRIPKKFGHQWRKEYVTLPPGKYSVIFQAKMSAKFGNNDIVGLDNVEVFEEDCQTVRNYAPACQTASANELCQNGGSCRSLGKKSFTCTCLQGYYGLQCQQKLPCVEKPCKNNGKCTDLGHSNYTCACESSFSGQQCKHVITCADPRNIVQHAVVKDVSKVTYYGVAKFECVHGYKMTGSGLAICSKQEEWQTNSKCLYIDCGEPPKIENAMKVDVSNTSLNGEAQYICIAGHVMTKGTGSLTCKLTEGVESWQDENGAPVTNAIKCDADCGPVNDVIQNGQLETVSKTTSGGQATFTCNKGFLPHSIDSSRQCGENGHCPAGAVCTVTGTWVAQVLCQPVDCGTPPKMRNAQAQFSATDHRATVRYSCITGSKSMGRDGIAICGDNGYWSDSLTGKNILSTASSDKEAIITCHTDCGDSAKIAGNYTVVKSTGTTQGNTAEVGCKDGFLMLTQNGRVSNTGTVHAVCPADNGQWYILGSCFLVDCKTPPNITNAFVKTVTNTTLEGEATYICNTGYKFLPEAKSKLKCRVNRYHRNGKEGRWRSDSWNQRPEDVIKCVEIPNCKEPPVVENGHVVRVTNTSLFGRATYQCYPGYVALGGADLAVCWPYTSSNIEYAEWALVPTCRRQCAIKNGADGPGKSIKVNLTSCTSHSFAHFHAKEDCSKPTMHVVYRDRPYEEGSSMKYYGKDLCVAQFHTRKNLYNNRQVSTKKECKTFCLNSSDKFRRVLVEENLDYQGPPMYNNRHVSVRKTFIKYNLLQ